MTCRPAPASPRRARLLLPVLALAALALAGPLGGQSPPELARSRAERLIEDPAADRGLLAVECQVRYDTEIGAQVAAGGLLHFETVLGLGELLDGPLPASLRVTLVAAPIEGPLVVYQETAIPTGLAGADAWLHRGSLALPDELLDAAVIVEDMGSARWGGCVAVLTDVAFQPPPDALVVVQPLPGEAPARMVEAVPAPGAAPVPAPGAAPAPAPGAAPAGPSSSPGTSPGPMSAPPPGSPVPAPGATGAPPPPPPPPPVASSPATVGAQGGRVIAVLPPRGRTLTGRTRFRTLATTELVQRVVFFLDGAEVASDDRAPFTATLDLGSEPLPHTVRVVGYERGGLVLGEHQITVNQRQESFGVRITALDPLAEGGGMRVAAEVAIPPGQRVDRIEIFRGETLIARREGPTEPGPARVPVAADVPGEAGPEDFVRVVATLSDGTWSEDVALLAGGALGERVEVNLVQLFTVVTGRDDQPVDDLTAEDFRVRLRREDKPIERFQRADDVPLTLGLLIDTSGSMETLIIDTKQAAARFLVETLIAGDRAFLVDFDDRPRLAQPPTGDVTTLLRSFGRLGVGGATALYDSIVFSIVQLSESEGRRALVLLTDGQDYGSRFNVRRAIDDARAEGSPVYVLSLAGLYNERGSVRKPDLEAITKMTGGRIYYITDLAQLHGAYDQINRELRTQYILAFATDRPLTEEEVQRIEVTVTRPGLTARTVVGQR